MFKLYDFQENIINKMEKNLLLYDRFLVQSATGSGKTVIMSSFVRQKCTNKKVLILVHREELVMQTSETLARVGIFNETITAKSKPSFISSTYVGMVETIWARKLVIPEIDIIIVDECHIGNFEKVFELYPQAKIIGFTATPVVNKRKVYFECEHCGRETEKAEVCCFNDKTEKYSAPVTLSEIYQDIIVGPQIKELIEKEFLCDELVFTYDYFSELEAKNDDEFDENEIAEVSIKHDQNVLEEYEEKCKGKKTMIFTASTKQNISLVDIFENFGYNIKSYDTVNNERTERFEIVNWFKNTDDAILVSTGTFTTGFDVKEVQAIIVNRPIGSLSLWHQIVGRGARTTDKIFKDNFILIDLGGNVARLGKWSDYINWEDIFFKGLKRKKKKKKELIQCDKCSYNFVSYLGDPCPECNHINQPIPKEPPLKLGSPDVETERVLKKTQATSVIPLPNGKKISEYVKRTTDNKNDYFNILIDKYIDLWKFNKVDSSIYFQRKESGILEVRIKEYLKKNYGYVNQLTNGVPRTYEYLTNKIKTKLSKCYE